MQSKKLKVKNQKLEYKKIKGANIDIDLTTDPSKISWKQGKCPWNEEEKKPIHRCAVKNTSICKYFRGIEPLDTVICAFKSKKF